MKINVCKDFLKEQDRTILINYLDQTDQEMGPMVNTRRTIRFGIDKFNGTSDSIETLPPLERLIISYYIKKSEEIINDFWKPKKPIFTSTLWLSKQTAGSYIKPHSDLDGGVNSQYTHSGIIYLNTQQEGGELFFPVVEKEFKPEAGDFISFDCKEKESLHGVKMTTQNRYAIPIWFTDLEEYRIK
jgi:hypothetical protein